MKKVKTLSLLLILPLFLFSCNWILPQVKIYLRFSLKWHPEAIIRIALFGRFFVTSVCKIPLYATERISSL